jgi:hypothetical protein
MHYSGSSFLAKEKLMYLVRAGLITALTLPLYGCPSIDGISQALKGPVAAAKTAAEVSVSAEQDILRAELLGAIPSPTSFHLPTVICTPGVGPSTVGTNLGTFVDALATIDKVASKPANTSYAALFKKLKDNNDAQAKSYDKERDEAVAERKRDRERCQELAEADLEQSSIYSPTPVAGAGVAKSLATFVALDELAKALLSAKVQVSTAAAVKTTVTKLSDQMDKAVVSLKAVPTDEFGPRVVFTPNDSLAAKMNGTTFGATITIRRWWVAKTVQGIATDLAQCRKGSPSTGCLSSIQQQQAADAFVTAAYQYRALARINTDTTIKLLSEGVGLARKAATDTSVTGFVDAFSSIGTALSDVNDKYNAYQKTRD